MTPYLVAIRPLTTTTRPGHPAIMHPERSLAPHHHRL